MTVTIKSNVKQKLQILANANTDLVLENAGFEIIDIVQERTSQGKGVNKRFKPYSKPYKKFKKKSGRRITPVNLEFSGEMLRAMSSEISERGNTKTVSVNFPNRKHSNSNASVKEIAQYNHKTRPFFDLNKSEETKVRNGILKDLGLIYGNL